jgi:hypothetical protein
LEDGEKSQFSSKEESLTPQGNSLKLKVPYHFSSKKINNLILSDFLMSGFNNILILLD